MKTKVFLMVAICVLTACSTSKKAESNHFTGNDRDEHGCLPSAGYTWSVLRNDCIRIFEDGIQLINATDADATFASYVVFAPDNNRVELYIPEMLDNHPILYKLNDANWTDTRFSLKIENGKLSLYDNSTLIFKEK